MQFEQDPKKEGVSKKSRPKNKKDNKGAADDEDEWAALMAQAPIKKEKKVEQPPETATTATSASKKKRNKKKKAENTTEAENKSENASETININENLNKSETLNINETEIINRTGNASENMNETEMINEAENKTEKKANKKKKKAADKSATTTASAPAKKKNQALLARMKETLERQRLEEERKKEEDEAIRKALEDAEAQDREMERLETELKEKRKQEKKERLQRLKDEGKPVTKSQKQNYERLEMMMEALKIQGVEIPHKVGDSTEKKPVVYGKKKKKPVKINKDADDTVTINGIINENNNNDNGIINENNNNENGIVDENNNLLEVKRKREDSENVPDDWEAALDAEMKLENGESVSDNCKTALDAERPREKRDNVPDDWEAALDAEMKQELKNDKQLVRNNWNTQLESTHIITTKEQITTKDQIEDKIDNIRKKKKLRSPVVCVLGHVDTGKTKILDKLRLTNVQAGEAGGITQQIGVTNVGKQNIADNLEKLPYMNDFRFLIPGFLIIDTPGHESFRNLRSRGSSLCDIAILVVDIMHGIEQQTLESFKLLMEKKAPFIIALNKIDRLYNWKSHSNLAVSETLLKQEDNTKHEFRERFNHVLAQFAEQGVNIGLFNEIDDFRAIIPVVPTSAHSGDGISDLIATVCKYSQSFLLKRLTRNDSILQLIAMEVKSVVGLGIVVDAILINGLLTEGDTIVLSGTQGPIVTQIKAILTSQPMTDLRASKGNFTKHLSVNESQGIRISAAGELENIIAGTPIHVVSPNKPLDICIQEATHYVENALNAFQTEEVGVYVQASTLGSLEALMEFLDTSKINVAGVNIGPVHKKDVLKASVMHQKEPMYAVILAFDVKVESEAILYAKKENVIIFTADIIYHLFDAFTKYTKECKEAKKEQHRSEAVFPCKLTIMPQYIFNERDPIILGVTVEAGSLHIGTPICVPTKDFTNIGTVATIEINKKPITKATAGQQIAIKINPANGETPKMFGRHFDASDMLVSKITRDSIDIQKEYFRDEMIKSDWQLIVELKKSFGIL